MDWNLIVILLYLLLTGGIGLFMTVYVRKEADFFIGGRSLNPWVVAGTVMGTNVAAIYLVGPAGAAYQSGVAVLLIAWTGNMIAALSAAFVVPRLRRMRITTVTDLFEDRYNRTVRLIPVILWVVYYSIFAGTNIYALCLCLSSILPFDVNSMILVIGPFLILFCAGAGLLAVVYTDVLQTFLMILGGVILLPLALREVGGVEQFIAKTPPEMFTFWHANGLWPNWRDVLMFTILGFPFWCTSQFMLQRTFAAKSVKAAAFGVALAALMTGVLTFFYIIPGICGKILYGADEALMRQPDMILPHMFRTLIPTGLGGLFIAALMAASNSTVSSLLNSAATLFSNDLYRPLRPGRSGAHYTNVGRLVTLGAGAIAILFALNVARLGGILQAIYTAMAFFEPPIFMIVMAALFMRKATNAAALTVLIGGTVINGCFLWICDFSASTSALLIFPVCLVLLLAASLFTKNTPEKQSRIDAFLSRMSPGKLSLTFRGWSGVAVSVIGLAGFLLLAFGESQVAKPLNVLLVLAAVTIFILGFLLLLPDVIGREDETGEEENLALEHSLINRIFGSGWSYLAVYLAAGGLMLLLYFR